MVECLTIPRVAVLFVVLAVGKWGVASPNLPVPVSVTLSRQTASAIKPCQAVTVVVDVVMKEPMALQEWRRMCLLSSEHVTVNGREYGNLLAGTSAINQAAIFELAVDEETNKDASAQDGSRRGHLIVTLFVDFEKKCALFRETGDYHVVLRVCGTELSVDVHVSKPTEKESNLIKVFDDLRVLLFLSDPENPRYATDEVLAMLKPIAEEESVYSRSISQAVGLATLRPSAKLLDSSQEEIDAELARRSMEAYRWLSPNCDGEIGSRLDAKASFRCAFLAGETAKTLSGTKAKEMLLRRKQLLQAVADSPLSCDESEESRRALESIAEGARLPGTAK